jgi:CBS-domain-containing membrane protein
MVIEQNKSSWVVPFHAASIDDSVVYILQKMVLHHVMVMPVVDANGCFCGVVRATEIMRAAVSPAYHFISEVSEVPELVKGYEYFLKTSHDITAKDVMEEDDTFVAGEDLRPSQLFYLFAKYGHERIFVIDVERKISGMVALADLLGKFNAR